MWWVPGVGWGEGSWIGAKFVDEHDNCRLFNLPLSFPSFLPFHPCRFMLILGLWKKPKLSFSCNRSLSMPKQQIGVNLGCVTYLLSFLSFGSFLSGLAVASGLHLTFNQGGSALSHRVFFTFIQKLNCKKFHIIFLFMIFFPACYSRVLKSVIFLAFSTFSFLILHVVRGRWCAACCFT